MTLHNRHREPRVNPGDPNAYGALSAAVFELNRARIRHAVPSRLQELAFVDAHIAFLETLV